MIRYHKQIIHGFTIISQEKEIRIIKRRDAGYHRMVFAVRHFLSDATVRTMFTFQFKL